MPPMMKPNCAVGPTRCFFAHNVNAYKVQSKHNTVCSASISDAYSKVYPLEDQARPSGGSRFEAFNPKSYQAEPQTGNLVTRQDPVASTNPQTVDPARLTRPSGASRLEFRSSFSGVQDVARSPRGDSAKNASLFAKQKAQLATVTRPSGLRRVSVRAAVSSPSDVAPPSSSPDSRKMVVITGGNTGIGFEAAKALAEEGYDVTIACRSEERGQAAVKRLQEAVPAASFSLVPLRLDDLTSVRDCAKRLQDAGRPIDVLLNNAGVMACPEMRTTEGFEYQFGVNHLGHFVLTAGLLPLLSDPSRSARIVNVSSAAQLFGTINFDDVNFKKNYSRWPAYGQSKLANAMFSAELSKRLPLSASITSNSLHPGVVDTELARHLVPDNPNPILEYAAKLANKAIGIITPVEGAQTSIYLASSDEVEGVTGKYFEKSKPATASWKVYVQEKREKLWDISCELTGEPFDVAALVKSGKVAV